MYESTYFLLGSEQIVGQSTLFIPDSASVLEKKKPSDFKPEKLRLIIDLVSYAAGEEGLVCIYVHTHTHTHTHIYIYIYISSS